MELKIKTLILIIILFTFNSCKKDKTCNEAINPIKSLYAELDGNSDWKEERVSFDWTTHGYSFKMDKSGKICSIGYQSHNQIGNYQMEIKDEDGEILFQEIISFDSLQTEYKSISEIEIQEGIEYTIRRTALNNTRSVGRILETTSFNVSGRDTLILPIIGEEITITNVKFEGDGLQDAMDAIPFIDFGFKID